MNIATGAAPEPYPRLVLGLGYGFGCRLKFGLGYNLEVCRVIVREQSTDTNYNYKS